MQYVADVYVKLASSLLEKVTCIVSASPTHVPLFVVFKINVSPAKLVSVALIVYTAFKVFAFGEKVPVPLVIHTPVVVLPETEPFH